MKSNDMLLCQMIQAHNPKLITMITDQNIVNPKKIKVHPNEVVYLHFFYSHMPDFKVEIQTATETLLLDDKNTIHQSSNTILKAVSDIHFKTDNTQDFFVQLLRTQY
ncbi:hypothetical protein [Aquimarina algiphila]|uniref:Uncharacterized protein n=1 Tax=Aquimarina algiphila TaxID=2047982 RepID=A0A554VNR0_9FLAO|nr:hypothetical protein [Aquimarina algiphila]TSE10002.1 hypothetical protein FOF46_06790 [Aquimarina algiphila]